MSWTDPCGKCGNHRADCDCSDGYHSTYSDDAAKIAEKVSNIEKRVLIIEADDWQVCYVDGKSISQAHSLGEGYGLLGFLKENAKKYNFTIDDIKECFVAEEDTEELCGLGCFPDSFSDLKGNYTTPSPNDR